MVDWRLLMGESIARLPTLINTTQHGTHSPAHTQSHRITHTHTHPPKTTHPELVLLLELEELGVVDGVNPVVHELLLLRQLRVRLPGALQLRVLRDRLSLHGGGLIVRSTMWVD